MMGRADCLSVWGNCLLPCILAGDDKQLQPTVKAGKIKTLDDHPVNRHEGDATLSPLLFLKASGWPVYRLTVQLRMANGQFDLCHKLVYPDVPIVYGKFSDINLPRHEPGRSLEAYAVRRFPGIKPSPEGKLLPIFIHCDGSFTWRDAESLSKINYGQIETALDLLVDLVVKYPSLDLSSIALISPYKANVASLDRKLKKDPKYTILAGIQEPKTVDSFQGREGDIVMLVMGTTAFSGPGFTRDEYRLNVMLSRQRSGLVIVSDINTIDTGKETGKGKPKGKDKRPVFKIKGEGGKIVFGRGTMLHDLHKGLKDLGRVVTVVIAKDKGRDKENATDN
ncbi:AAA domain-containing protein [Stachybotrys elegans]|uniref:AAA domain-containing protein n=1 Tax=Stachybotrys elegans TaxID=80388 RepID=A0A8K0SQX9_9HYPO|nr:AAA domain-containing protein [Stachybotrys elegans]